MHALCHGIDETSASVPFGYNREWLQVAEAKKLRGNADGLHVSKALTAPADDSGAVLTRPRRVHQLNIQSFALP